MSPRQDDRTPPLGWRVVPQKDIPDLAAALKATIAARRTTEAASTETGGPGMNTGNV